MKHFTPIQAAAQTAEPQEIGASASPTAALVNQAPAGFGPDGLRSTSDEPIYRSLYSGERGMIACVLLQAAYRGDRAPCHFFGSGDWETGLPDQTFGWFELPRSVWRRLGMMRRDQRVAFYVKATGGAA